MGLSKNILKSYLMFKQLRKVLLLTCLVPFNGCVEEFTLPTSVDQNLLVVEGLITDQPVPSSIKISTSNPLGVKSSAKPLSGCSVTIKDDLGNFYNLTEGAIGMYSTDSHFQGVAGRSYTLYINTNSSHHNLTYESFPVLMKPVPSIDSLYYDKVVLSQNDLGFTTGEGCQIYLNTHDPDNNCRFFRWEYVETWEFRLPYYVPNNICWVSGNSDRINIKSTSSLSEDKIDRLPVNFVSNTTDRLRVKYSILVNQYSLNEDEYVYWEKLKNLVEQVGSLYDIIPSSTQSNVRCIEKPSETVLGYFSVSAVKSKRLFITDRIIGTPDLYKDCEDKRVGYNDSIPNLNSTIWIIIENPTPPPGYKVLTFTKGCADCTVRGTKVKPDFWIDSK
jgi:hypothetical protein